MGRGSNIGTCFSSDVCQSFLVNPNSLDGEQGNLTGERVSRRGVWTLVGRMVGRVVGRDTRVT